MALLENITFHIRDLSEVLAAAIWEGPLDIRMGEGLREPLARCLSATANVLKAWEENSAGPEVFDEATKSVSALSDAVAAAPALDGGSLTPGATVALDIRRILTALRHRLLPESSAEEAV